MYFAAIAIHSLLRWAVLVTGVLAVVAVARGGVGARRRAVPFVVCLDLQLIAGAALWLFLSPLTQGLSAAALRDHEVRRFAAEHPALGILAVALAHGGSVLLKRGRGGPGAALLAAALVVALAAVPWARPLFRM